MAKHNPAVAADFRTGMNTYNQLNEQELMERLNTTIVDVELDDTYSTNEKLKIYALISSLTNCSVRERKKYIRKIDRALR